MQTVLAPDKWPMDELTMPSPSVIRPQADGRIHPDRVTFGATSDASGARTGKQLNMVSSASRNEPDSNKFHELAQTCTRIVIDIALLDFSLRAVMKVLGIGRYPLPIYVWKIVMTVHGAVDMSPFPMI